VKADPARAAARAALSDEEKISKRRAKRYAPVRLTDRSVFDLAGVMTAEELAELFGVDTDTLMARHGEAFRAGRASYRMARRQLLDRFIDEAAAVTTPGQSDPKEQRLFLDAITLWMKRYDGLGSPATRASAALEAALPSVAGLQIVPFLPPAPEAAE
jgi:hypothetical protein